MAITTAVVPVAGLATRLRPLSRGVPKGLLPVAGQPVIQHIVDELAACGIERIVLVTGRGRAAFAAHFAESDGPEMVCVTQPEPLGLGDAILCAGPVLDGPFVIALGDALLGRGAPAVVVGRLAAAVEAGAEAAVAVEEVAADATRHYGIVVPAGDGEDPLPVTGSSRSPSPGRRPAGWRSPGATPPPPHCSTRCATPRATPTARSSFSDALTALHAVVALRLAPGEERLDVGTVPGYCAAFVEYALSDAELGPALRARAAALLDGRR